MQCSRINIFGKLAFFFNAVLFLAAAAGCRPALPPVKDVILEATQTNAFPELIGPKGPLPYGQAEAIIKALEQKAWWSDILQQQIALAELIGGLPLTDGNKATLLINDQATYAAMRKAIENARDTVNLETFIFKDDNVGREFAALLLKKRAEGVRVDLIYDGAGCFDSPNSFFQHLQDGGVNTLEYNPLNLSIEEKFA